jgi:hypothetical protein
MEAPSALSELRAKARSSFLKKKQQKTFIRLAAAFPDRAVARMQPWRNAGTPGCLDKNGVLQRAPAGQLPKHRALAC